MNRITRLPALALLFPALFATTAVEAGLDPRLRGCYDTFMECIDQVPEKGPDGRYPIAKEQTCEVAYERCRVRLGFPPTAAPLGAPGPTNTVED